MKANLLISRSCSWISYCVAVRKNTLLLDSEPLVARPIRQAIESGVIGTVLVTTDDNEIAKISETAGAIVPFIRPAELSQDLTSTEDTLKHALLEYEREIKKNVIIKLQKRDGEGQKEKETKKKNKMNVAPQSKAGRSKR